MTTLLEEAISQIRKLPESEQNDIAQSILNQLQQKKYLLKGKSGQELLKFAGSIDSESLQLISQAIEEDCTNININNW